MKEQFEQWVARLQISEAGQKIIEKVRSSEPSRRVGGGSKNVSGRYPSRKMEVTIQFESHRVELPIIYQLEHNQDVLEFYDQPPQIKLDYQATNGRRLGVLHNWKAKYLTAQQKYGCGYIGLLSHRSVKGNRQRKLPEDTLAIMEKFILEDYETIKQKRMREVYGALVLVCEQSGVIAPSYKAFTKEIKHRPVYEQTKKRKGRRAAYKHESFYWELTKTTPRHGVREAHAAGLSPL